MLKNILQSDYKRSVKIFTRPISTYEALPYQHLLKARLQSDQPLFIVLVHHMTILQHYMIFHRICKYVDKHLVYKIQLLF